jgi:hypothetical protein
MATYYNIASYLTDKGGVPLLIDIAVDQPDGAGGYYLYTNQPTGSDTQLWTIVDGPSPYVFIQSQWKDPSGNQVVIDIHQGSNRPGTRLDGYPQKSTGYDNQLWVPFEDVTSGYVFYQSKLSDPAGSVLVIDIEGNSTALKTPLDAYPQKSTNYQNQLWQLSG